MEDMNRTEIVYKSENAIVVYKPPLVPSQQDKTGLADVLSIAEEQLRNMGEEDRLYPVNRLDAAVGGLLIAARTGLAAASLSSIVADGRVRKEYFAVADGLLHDGHLVDYLSKDSRINKAIVHKSCQNGAKYAELYLKTLCSVDTSKGVKSLVRVELVTGRFHQIRAQLSSRGTPICGDKKYGSRDFGTRTPALFAAFISLDLEGEQIRAYKCPPTDTYPWNLFPAELYILNDEGPRAGSPIITVNKTQ